jgi:serine/threonine protein kinase
MAPELSTDDRDMSLVMTPSPSMDGVELMEFGKPNKIDQETQDTRSRQALKQSLIESKDVKLAKRVGAGAFGEVFKGTVLGQPVAVKTMLKITDVSVRAFRNEILLTATLRHPNIVSFVGACWGKDLMALVLEWVPRGSLADLLEDKSLDLHWGEPLLKLAMDVARGMIYLHGREYFDERDCEQKRCILHRDLKPDNALVTDYTTLKITDFGASRAKAADDVTMTGVGTPLFCAPELSREEPYDEKADVYSFGLVLVDMASDELITDFIGERWKAAFNKKKVPNPQALAYNKVLWPIWEGQWRPVSVETPIEHAPGTINDLIFRCTAHDPQSRPSFVEILEFLAGPCMVEVEGAVFSRHLKKRKDGTEDTLTKTDTEAADGFPDYMANESEEHASFHRLNPMSGARDITESGTEL